MPQALRMLPGSGALGVAATLLTVACVEVLTRAALIAIPNPPLLALIPVIYAGFAGGVRYGLVCAALAVAYSMYFFADPGSMLVYEDLDRTRLAVIAVVAPFLGWMTGAMRARAQRDHSRQLERERTQQAELRHAAELLRNRETQMRVIIDAVPAMIAYLDAEQRYLFCNRLYAEAFGRSEQAIVGRHAREVVGEETYERAGPWIRRALAGETVRYERTHYWPGGRRCELAVSYVPHVDDQRRMIGYFTLLVDITEQKAEQGRLLHVSRHDPLTGLPNRAQLEERLPQAVARSRRSGRPMALLFLDIDKFKAVNDRYGHAIGDELLRQVAARIRSCVRETDTVARLGGDEFVVLLEMLNTEADAAQVAGKLVASMKEAFHCEAVTLESGVSVGVATASGDALDAERLMKRADEAMYEAKTAGRNSFRLAAPACAATVPPPRSPG